MGGRLDRDMNRRFNTTALNLASVRRARKRYSFTRSLTYTFSVLGAFLKRVLDFPADWMPLSKPYQHKPHVSLCFTRHTHLHACHQALPAPGVPSVATASVAAQRPSEHSPQVLVCDTCILRPVAFCLYPDHSATAVPSPHPRSACRGSCSGPPVTAWCANLLSRQPPRSSHTHISATRTTRLQRSGGRRLPTARGLHQRCPPGRCAPASRARSRQASLQIPWQHRLAPQQPLEGCHITYGTLMPCCALAAPLI